ncbi:MAG: ZIP family metal transporter, partial [Solirubrobacterales bacterium]
MEAAGATERTSGGVPTWLLGVIPLALIVIAIGLFAALGAPGLGERPGPPVEELAVERTELHPGEIQLTIRNDGPDAVDVAQVTVNDAFVPFEAHSTEVGRLGATTLTIPYPWVEGEGYGVGIFTSTGGTLEHEIPVAVETPDADADFYGLMGLLGLYVGIIPITLGMLWLPFVRRVSAEWLRVLIAFTIGLLAFLAVDAGLEGLEIADAGPGAFGGNALVYLGALVAYLALSGVDGYLSRRREKATDASGGAVSAAPYLALLVAIGIGLHNLGEGLAIGSAYAAGALALGTFLVVGFAIHNTTEGLAIVSPLATTRPTLGRLLLLGAIAGAPAILGAWVGAAAFNPSAAALLFG